MSDEATRIDFMAIFEFRCDNFLNGQRFGHIFVLISLQGIEVPKLNSRIILEALYSSRWWFQIFFYFDPDPWGNDPI